MISLLPENPADTANLSKELELAVDMKYDFTANVDVADGLTNGASCELKMIENRQTDKTFEVLWLPYDRVHKNVNRNFIIYERTSLCLARVI